MVVPALRITGIGRTVARVPGRMSRVVVLTLTLAVATLGATLVLNASDSWIADTHNRELHHHRFHHHAFRRPRTSDPRLASYFPYHLPPHYVRIGSLTHGCPPLSPSGQTLQ
jgi:hypothetical protein